MANPFTTFRPKDINVSLGKASNHKITNLSLSLANTEYSHSLISNLKTIIIKGRGDETLKYSFTSGESSTKYITIPKGAVLTLDSLDFTGETLYIQSNKASSIIEILELY